MKSYTVFGTINNIEICDSFVAVDASHATTLFMNKWPDATAVWTI